MKQQFQWKPYLAWILLAEAAGALAGWLIRDDTALYSQAVAQPPLSPPAIVFPIVWTALYALMGVSAARVWLCPASKTRRRGLGIFLLQLAFNFFWSILFFSFRQFAAAFFWLAALWALILWMLLTFRKADRPAALLQIPYLLWVTFAGYLNLGVWLLN